MDAQLKVTTEYDLDKGAIHSHPGGAPGNKYEKRIEGELS